MRMRRVMRRVVLAMLSGLPLLLMLPADAKLPETPTAAMPDAHQDIYAELGLLPKSLRLSAGGYVLDFRYQVLASERARRLINQQTQPYLIDEGSGLKVSVPAPPKIGPLRNTGRSLVEGRTYFILFANPARKIQRGDRVTIVLGEHRIEHLIVQ